MRDTFWQISDEYRQAWDLFNNAIDQDMIDAAIYKLLACEAMMNYYLSQIAKEEASKNACTA